ncbi:hypothetical protein GPECTOR_2g1219 [Gonium pectorale]|uniref:Uncharacterized protein n=1 Tax=Gonium pectorale TaxID=33097 RepID=A0A150H0M0_GONPE|nr:hypothetical protein GPECTOR_2g1219 [Gonium pectorale]|eukprot:KXZ55669.1 hypothetical protein GPECTOR_2g1219 [Gonium pectorale]
MLLQFVPSSLWLEDYFAAVNSRLRDFRPAELAHLCYAAGKLRVAPHSSLLGGIFRHTSINFRQYGMRELALLLYGLVHMGGELNPDWVRQYRVRVCALLVESEVVPPPTLQRWGPHLHPNALGPLVKARLREVPQDSSRGDVDAAQSSSGEPSPLGPLAGSSEASGERLAQETTRAGGGATAPAVAIATDLAVILGSMADWLYQPPQAFMEVALSVVGGSVQRLTATQLTGLLLTLAHMEYRPEPEMFQAIWARVMDSYDSLGRQHRTNALWAAGRLRCAVPRPHLWMILTRAARELYEHTDAEVVALLAAAAGLHFKAHQQWLLLFESHLFKRLPSFKPFELVSVLQSLVDLGHKPDRIWLLRWAEALKPGVAELGLTHISSAAYAVARLGFRPPAGLRAELLRVSAQRMAAAPAASREGVELRSTSGQQSSEQMNAAARGTSPSRTKLRKGVDNGGEFQRIRVLSRLLWSLAMLDIRPDSEWLAAYLGCLGASLEYCSAHLFSM